MLTQEKLKQAYSYDPQTGIFIRLRSHNRPAGTEAGHVTDRGYICVHINGRSYRAHRLAWLYMTGAMPPSNMDIDHINGIRTDNRFANLRLATRSENIANSKKYKSNSTGFKGVFKDKNRWRVQMTVNGRKIGKGSYKTPEQAYEAYCKAAKEYFGEFSNLGVPAAMQSVQEGEKS